MTHVKKMRSITKVIKMYQDKRITSTIALIKIKIILGKNDLESLTTKLTRKEINTLLKI